MSTAVTRKQKYIIWTLVALTTVGVLATDIAHDRTITCAIASEGDNMPPWPWVHEQLCEEQR